MLAHLKKLWEIVQHAMQQKKVRQLLYLIIVVLSLGFITIVIKANWAELKKQEFHIDGIFLVLSVILYPLGMLPTVAAWHWILRAFNIIKPFRVNLRLYALSSLPRHIPGLVWYVTSRTLLYKEQGVRIGMIVGATAFETAILALSGFISALLILPLQANLPQQLSIIRYLIPISAIILAAIIIWAPGGSRLLDRFIKRWQKEREEIVFQRSALWICLVWTFVAWVGGGILLWILVRAFTPIGSHLLPFMVGIWGLAGAVSLTIGVGIQGLGLREVTLGALLTTIISPIQAITTAIAFRLVLTLGELIWVFLISLVLKNSSNRDNQESPNKSPY